MKQIVLNALIEQACKTGFNIVALPLRDKIQRPRFHKELELLDQYLCVANCDRKPYAKPLTQKEWKFDPSFVLFQFQKILGNHTYVNLIECKDTDSRLILTAHDMQRRFYISTLLDNDENKAIIQHVSAGEIGRNPEEYEIVIAGIMNIFSALGYSEIEIKAQGTEIALLVRMGFLIPDDDVKSVYSHIRNHLIRELGPEHECVTELSCTHFSELETILSHWGFSLGIQALPELKDALEWLTVDMYFDTKNQKQIEKLIGVKSAFHETRPLFSQPDKAARNNINIAP